MQASWRRRVVAALIAVPVLAVPVAAAAAAAPTPSPASSTATPATSGGVPAAVTPGDASAAAGDPDDPPTTPAPAALKAPGPACTTDANAQYPVICLPAGSGEDQATSLAVGDVTVFAAQLVDNGAPVADATFTISLPAGLDLPDNLVERADNFYRRNTKGSTTRLRCTASLGGRTVTCHTGAIAQGTNALIVLPLLVSPDAKPATTLSFTATLAPVAPTTFLATSVRARVRILQPARLVVKLHPTALSVTVGDKAQLVATVTNKGKGPAPFALALAITAQRHIRQASHFVITNGSRSISIGGGGGSGSGGGAVPVIEPKLPASLTRSGAAQATMFGPSGRPNSFHRLLQRRVGHRMGPDVAFWNLHTIRPGATKTITVKLRAVSAGRDRFAFLVAASHNSGVPMATARLMATKPVALANSGAGQLGRQVGLGLLSVVLGGCALAFGRRRRPRRG